MNKNAMAQNVTGDTTKVVFFKNTTLGGLIPLSQENKIGLKII
jgi:hypothetical protein